jgi:PHD/YefM family antitoxin component YafN of YafNO toxin-antitoxin module
MLDINRDINSLSNFKRNTPEFLRQLKETGHPIVLTINGKAELVVQDTASYQKLIELAERAEELEITRRAVAEMKAGLGRPAAEMLAEMQRIIDEKRAQ